MKKVILAVMAVAAISFTTSCGNKTAQGEAVDSVAVVEEIDGDEVAEGTISALSAQLEAADATKLQEVLESVKVKVAELIKQNPEVAKEYVEKVQTFIKDNADKIKAVIGDNAAAAAACSAVTSIEPEAVVKGLIESAGDAATEAKDAAVDAANQKVEEAKDAAKQKAEEAKDAAKQKASEAIDGAAEAAKKKLGI